MTSSARREPKVAVTKTKASKTKKKSYKSKTNALNDNENTTTTTTTPSSKPTLKGPIRLDPEVLRTAAQFADINHRSVPNQIEYWTKLGQLLECALSTTEVHQLLSGTKCLGKVEVGDHVDLTFDSIVNLVETARADGSIREVTSAEFVYDTDNENRLRRTDRNGNATFGKIVANKFVELPASK